MKITGLILAACLLMTSVAWGQSAAPQTPPAQPPQRGMEGSSEDQHRMHQHHMQAMGENIARMQALLDQMKSNVEGMTGKDKAAMQANVELWQMMIDHMKQMSQHMQGMREHGERE
jgi:TolA-binding protein